MVNKYFFRKNFKLTYSDHEQEVYGRMAFKTRWADWLNTTLPAVILVSVQSTFHEGIDGHFKMATFLSTIKENVKGKISILIADLAHLHTLSLAECQDPLAHCLQSAQKLIERYRSYIDGMEVLNWSCQIMTNENYASLKKQLQEFIQMDETFRSFLLTDAENAYTEKRKKEFPNKELFIRKTIDDLIEQCVCIKILAQQGYRYLFYPGTSYTSIEYINRNTPVKNYLQWIDVFVTIEKKTKRTKELQVSHFETNSF